MTAIDTLEFRPLTIPASVDADDAADFIDLVHVRNRVYREISGHDDHAMTPSELLPHYQPDPDETRYVWAVVVDGRIIGRVGVDIPHEEGSRASFALIEILREHHGKGIGRRAADLVEQVARENGRSVIQTWVEHPDAPGERLDAPTGFGSVPLDRSARFLRAQGYTLEQVERGSSLDLTAGVEKIQQLLRSAEEAAAGYRVVQWTAPTPAEFVDRYAWMKSRMSTDAPSADMEIDEETWDADRIARHDQRWIDGGMTVLVTAAQHVESGELCAFNELAIGTDMTAATDQEDTLVLTEHRGHRLGMLVKCAGLLAWRDIAPDSPKVLTYNAEENRPMLDINEAIGFEPVAYEGAWKKELT